MKIYVIFEDQRWYKNSLVGVFDSHDKAVAAKQKLLDEYSECGTEFDIEEWEVQ